MRQPVEPQFALDQFGHVTRWKPMLDAPWVVEGRKLESQVAPLHNERGVHTGTALTMTTLCLERLVAGIVKYHLAHLITDLLPVVNEVAGLFFAHYFSALVF